MGTSGRFQTKVKHIELLLLGSLCHLVSRGWMFDDLEENTGIGDLSSKIDSKIATIKLASTKSCVLETMVFGNRLHRW
jgi:hypothetical protein